MDERLKKIEDRYMKREYDYALSSMDIDWLIQQAEKAQELEEVVNKAENHLLRNGKEIMKLTNDIAELKYRNQRYKEALEFYADENNHGDSIEDFEYEPPIYHDNGEKARQALKGEPT